MNSCRAKLKSQLSYHHNSMPTAPYLNLKQSNDLLCTHTEPTSLAAKLS